VSKTSSVGCQCGACHRERQRDLDRKCIVIRLRSVGVNVKDWYDVVEIAALLRSIPELEREP
jgi:hypothetical protein